ncbi:MAG: decaprenyl-phosphate phosphoribosyltransferase [Chloroflexi bacterium]|nr:decaprenyl-phosphate phosphoribosyltransferase [Chloroflexota bacterium]
MESSRRETPFLSMLGVSKAFVLATRPKQWTKNLIIFLAFFFTVNEAWNPPDTGEMFSLAARTALAFVIFSVLTGAIYLINDVFDIEKDRIHPKKRFRPIASGQLPINVAWAGATTLIAVGLSSAFLLEPLFGGISLAYVTLMIAYTLVIKRLILLDVFAISAGFVLRAVAGAVVLGVPISPWLYICTGLGSLFLALTKRRSELAIAGENAGNQRDTLEHYTLPLLDQLISVVATSTVLAYALYTFTAPNLPENNAMMLTIPFVVYGLFRYMYLVHTKDTGENPEDTLITDAPLVITIVLWLATAATILGLLRG